MPTLLDLMGQSVPEGLDGKSIATMLGEPAPATAEDVFIEWAGTETGIGLPKYDGEAITPDLHARPSDEQIDRALSARVRTVIAPNGWKMSLSEIGEHELYDLSADPQERTNLFPRPEHADRKRDLRNRIAAWQQRTHDTFELPEI